jgi:hypothetical protein
MLPTPGVRTKGTGVNAVSRFVSANWGAEGLKRLAAAMPSLEAAEMVRTGVLVGSWYPFAHLVSLLEQGEALFGEGSGTFAKRMGASCADFDLRGVYRIFIRFAAPGYLIERASKVWRQYYDSGELAVIEADPARRVVFELSGFATPHRGHCDTVLGWTERAFELSGVQNVRGEHPSCRARGDCRCLFRVEWE